jgi:hypothetical protein
MRPQQDGVRIAEVEQAEDGQKEGKDDSHVGVVVLFRTLASDRCRMARDAVKPRMESLQIIGGIRCSVFTRELEGPLAAPIGRALSAQHAFRNLGELTVVYC